MSFFLRRIKAKKLRWSRVDSFAFVQLLELNPPALYALHVLATVALLLQGLAVAGRLLHVGQHVGHQRLLQPLPHAVHQLLLLPARQKPQR